MTKRKNKNSKIKETPRMKRLKRANKMSNSNKDLGCNKC